MTTTNPKLLLAPPEAAARLGVGRTTLYRLLRSGEVLSVTIGRCRRIKPDALAAYAASLEPQATCRHTREVASYRCPSPSREVTATCCIAANPTNE
jgi:excisionase family DNA binding protein